MNQLTAVVLTISLLVAVAIFGGAALVRALAAGSRRRVLAGMEAHETVADPVADPGAGEADPVMLPERPVGKVPVWFYRWWDLVGVGLLFGLFAWSFVRNVWAQGPEPPLEVGVLLVNIALQFQVAGVIVFAVVIRVGWNTWLGLRWHGWPWIFLIAPGAVVFMWTIFMGLDQIGFTKWMESLGVETVQDTVQLLQHSDDPRILGLMSLAAVVVAPLCEEIMFRGYLYPVMKRFAGAWPAAVASALWFGCAHSNLAALLPLFLFGGLLVWLYEMTGSIWVPMAVHCCFNSATVVAQFALRNLPFPLDSAPG